MQRQSPNMFSWARQLKILWRLGQATTPANVRMYLPVHCRVTPAQLNMVSGPACVCGVFLPERFQVVLIAIASIEDLDAHIAFFLDREVQPVVTRGIVGSKGKGRRPLHTPPTVCVFQYVCVFLHANVCGRVLYCTSVRPRAQTSSRVHERTHICTHIHTPAASSAACIRRR